MSSKKMRFRDMRGNQKLASSPGGGGEGGGDEKDR